MIRLYIDADFKNILTSGGVIKIPADELKYLRVQRGRAGDSIELFNYRGQWARGVFKNGDAHIEDVGESKISIFPLTVALALPETAALESVVRSSSELGIERLIFFSGERSQSFKSRHAAILKRAERIALESVRQSARPVPLIIETGPPLEHLRDECQLREPVRFLDEVAGTSSGGGQPAIFRGENNSQDCEKPVESLVIGPEGGWSSRERDYARRAGWDICHYPTPILRVVTVVPVAIFDALCQRWFRIQST